VLASILGFNYSWLGILPAEFIALKLLFFQMNYKLRVPTRWDQGMFGSVDDC